MTALVRGICFHGIGEPRRPFDPGEDSYWVGADDYLRILDELMTWPQVSITFDDGNVSDVEHGLPALRERGLTATFFVLGGRIGSSGSLGTDDIAELVSAGMTVGSHGMDHRPWRGLSPTDLSRSPRRPALSDATTVAYWERSDVQATNESTRATGVRLGRKRGCSPGSVSTGARRQRACGPPWQRRRL